MNIFSNIGITELLVILLLALLVVGPERLPEMGRTLAKTLRDLRKAYENLTRDLGPELMSIQETTQELRESVESITSIPQDMIDSVVKAADLDDTIDDLKKDLGSLQEVGQTVSDAGKMIKNPVGAAVDTARGALLPSNPDESGEEVGESSGKENGTVDTAPAAVLPLQSDEQVVVEEEPIQAEGVVEVEEARGEQQERSDE
ncbi:MAG: twin-arginine translocase TatA/TatE family subunit [Anaerolineae bacterium]|jgi:sec-independent protein translocase protein TatB